MKWIKFFGIAVLTIIVILAAIKLVMIALKVITFILAVCGVAAIVAASYFIRKGIRNLLPKR